MDNEHDERYDGFGYFLIRLQDDYEMIVEGPFHVHATKDMINDDGTLTFDNKTYDIMKVNENSVFIDRSSLASSDVIILKGKFVVPRPKIVKEWDI